MSSLGGETLWNPDLTAAVSQARGKARASDLVLRFCFLFFETFRRVEGRLDLGGLSLNQDGVLSPNLADVAGSGQEKETLLYGSVNVVKTVLLEMLASCCVKGKQGWA